VPSTTLAEIDRISRDERHLATYPIALLSYQSKRGATISQTRERRHPVTQKVVEATWKVLGSEEWGLPTPSDDAVVLVLLEITRELGFPQEVYFTQRDILNRLGWPDNRGHYRKLEVAFNRLNSITIQSKNVFWDTTAGAFVNTGFHLIESFEIISKPGRRKSANGELPLSRFVWGEPLWRSFKDGNLKPISLSTYFSLHLPIARRLYRFLDLVRYDGKPKYRIGLRKLAEEFLGLSHAKYLSTYKNTLAPSHDELVAMGYLASVSYEEARAGGENVIYRFAPREADKAFEAHESPGQPLFSGASSETDASSEANASSATEAPPGLASTPGSSSAPRSSSGSLSGRLSGTPSRSRRRDLGAGGIMPSMIAAVLPSMPEALEVATREVTPSAQAQDSELRDRACDAVFEALAPEEQARLRQVAEALLPPFLREREQAGKPGTARTLQRHIRQSVRGDYPERVAAQVKRQAKEAG